MNKIVLRTALLANSYSKKYPMSIVTNKVIEMEFAILYSCVIVNSQKLSLSGARISRPGRDFVTQFSISLLGGLSVGAGSCGSTPEDV